jgi:hypothetical protein
MGSRDFEVCFLYQSTDLKVLPLPGQVRFLLKFHFCEEFFDFLVSALLVYIVS